ncbi:agmatinase [Syntrophomonas erecta]
MESIKEYIYQKAQFMAACNDVEICDKVILGLPMDSTTSFRPGTRLAPYRVREVSEGIEEYSTYLDRSLEEINFYDAGDVLIPFGNVVESLRRMEDIAREFLKNGKRLFSMGGEHLVTLPLVKAYHSFYPDLVVIQMDAHADLREEYLGERLSHATVMRHVVEELGAGNLYQMGIRSATREEMDFAARHTRLFFDQLPEVQDVAKIIGRRPVYLTLDIDVLDPAYAPGTGTPEAGGFSSRELLKVLHDFKCLNIVGFDLVEISPPYEKGDNTSILGAKVMREALLGF